MATLKGNWKDNSIDGTSAADFISGKGGNDILRGKSGRDEIIGGDGNDTLEGGNGQDDLVGGKGRDILNGGNGADSVKGGNGDDYIFVSAGADYLSGGNGSDTLDASTWEDGVWVNMTAYSRTDYSEPYPNYVQVDPGTMKLRDSGPNTDWTVQTLAADFESFVGSASKDWIQLDHAASHVETVLLGGGNDTFSGFSADQVNGGKGDDRISINQGTANGGKGDDILTATTDLTTNSSRQIKTYLNGGNGDDLLIISGNTKAKGGNGNDVLRFVDSDSDNRVFGGNGADVFEFTAPFASGVMRDFNAAEDKIDLSGYSGIDPTVTWAAIQGWFEAGDTGVRIRMDSQNFSNQLFEFTGLAASDLTESNFIL